MRMLLRIVSILLLLFNACGAIYGGTLFIVDPTGGLMGMDTYYLAHSPFKDYLFPGIILLVVNGLFNLAVAAMMLLNRGRWQLMVMAVGILLIGWIAIQVWMVEDISTLHVIMFCTGILLEWLGYVQWRMKQKPNYPPGGGQQETGSES